MKTIMLCETSVDATFSTTIVQVADDHPAVAFCEKWKATGEQAWIDHANDSTKLRKMWDKLQAKAPSSLALPCHIDYVIYGWYE